jgi:hypothetical protein
MSWAFLRAVTSGMLAMRARISQGRKRLPDPSCQEVGKEGTQFTRSPWTLEASIRWLERTDRMHPPPAQIRAVPSHRQLDTDRQTPVYGTIAGPMERCVLKAA